MRTLGCYRPVTKSLMHVRDSLDLDTDLPLTAIYARDLDVDGAWRTTAVSRVGRVFVVGIPEQVSAKPTTCYPASTR